MYIIFMSIRILGVQYIKLYIVNIGYILELCTMLILCCSKAVTDHLCSKVANYRHYCTVVNLQ